MGLRDRLAQKRGQETHFDVVLGDPTEAQAVADTAAQEHRLAVIRHGRDSEEAAMARAALDEANAELAQHVERIRLRNLEPDVFETMIGLHPAPEGTDGPWNMKTLGPALVAACAVDSDLTEEDWQAELASDRWTLADRTALYNQAVSANLSSRSVSVPKG